MGWNGLKMSQNGFNWVQMFQISGSNILKWSHEVSNSLNWEQSLLGSTVPNSGNLWIFLQLSFYVKSNLDTKCWFWWIFRLEKLHKFTKINILSRASNSETEFCNSVIEFQYRFLNSELVNFLGPKIDHFWPKIGRF